MTRRQAATIIGLLFVILTIVSIASLRNSTQAQDKDTSAHEVLLPVVQNAPGIDASSVSTDGVVVSRYPAIGVKASMAMTGEILASGDITQFIDTRPPNPALVAAIEKQMGPITPEEVAAHVIPAAGDKTVGSVIDIAGKRIPLPPNVYVEAFIVSGVCIAGVECLETPVYALKNAETGSGIAVSSKSGRIGDPSLSQEELTRLKLEFQWLVDAVGEK